MLPSIKVWRTETLPKGSVRPIPPVIASVSPVLDGCLRGRASLIIPSDRRQEGDAAASDSRVCVGLCAVTEDEVEQKKK